MKSTTTFCSLRPPHPHMGIQISQQRISGSAGHMRNSTSGVCGLIARSLASQYGYRFELRKYRASEIDQSVGEVVRDHFSTHLNSSILGLAPHTGRWFLGFRSPYCSHCERGVLVPRYLPRCLTLVTII